MGTLIESAFPEGGIRMRADICQGSQIISLSLEREMARPSRI
jgi:hypothetical protein